MLFFQLAVFAFGTLVHADDPWSGVQQSILYFQFLSFCTGTFLIWLHWSGGPEFDPSPGRISVPSLWSWLEACGFRQPMMRWVYARVFLLAFLMSAWHLGRNIVRTKGLTVLGVLADCVFPMQRTRVVTSAIAWDRDEFFARGGVMLVCALPVIVIASLTKVRVCRHGCSVRLLLKARLTPPTHMS